MVVLESVGFGRWYLSLVEIHVSVILYGATGDWSDFSFRALRRENRCRSERSVWSWGRDSRGGGIVAHEYDAAGED